MVSALAADPPPAKVSFYSAEVPPGAPAVASALRPLAALAQCPDAGVQALLADMLAHYYAADSLEQAFASRGSLPPGAQFIVREGHQVGRLTAMLHAADSEAEGMLARLHEIENLTREQRAQQLLVDDARGHAVRTE